MTLTPMVLCAVGWLLPDICLSTGLIEGFWPPGSVLKISQKILHFREEKKRSPISVTISVLYYVGSHLKGFFFQNQHTMESPGGLHPAPLSPNCSMGTMTSLKNASLDLVLHANMSFNALRETMKQCLHILPPLSLKTVHTCL